MKSNLIQFCVHKYRNKNDEEKRIGVSDVDSKIVLIQEHVTSTAVPKSKADHNTSITKSDAPFLNKNLVLRKSKSIAVDDSIHIRDEILHASESKSSNNKSSKSPIENLSLPILKISTDNRYRSTEENFYINVVYLSSNSFK